MIDEELNQLAFFMALLILELEVQCCRNLEQEEY